MEARKIMYTPGSTNIAVAGKWGPRIEDVNFLLKMGLFQPAMLVYQRVTKSSAPSHPVILVMKRKGTLNHLFGACTSTCRKQRCTSTSQKLVDESLLGDVFFWGESLHSYGMDAVSVMSLKGAHQLIAKLGTS